MRLKIHTKNWDKNDLKFFSDANLAEMGKHLSFTMFEAIDNLFSIEIVKFGPIAFHRIVSIYSFEKWFDQLS